MNNSVKISAFLFLFIISSLLYLTMYDFLQFKHEFLANIFKLWEEGQPYRVPKPAKPYQVPEYLENKYPRHLREEQYTQFPMELGDRGLPYMPEYMRKEPVNNQHFNETGYKKILLYNDFFGIKHFYIGLGHQVLELAGCPVSNCILSSNSSRYPTTEWDALVWHYWSDDKSLPKQRSPHSRYVFFFLEAPARLMPNELKEYNGIFNWTMTYRHDSTFPRPYDRIYQRKNVLPPSDLHSNIANKTKLAAWFVSNCNSKSRRERLGKALAAHMPIDIYGKCGTLQCPRSNASECYKMLDRDYKFYLAFENSICNDYITEKFFKTLNYNVVPVVYGGGDYAKHAPSSSYINALDFASAKDLAEYLMYLDKNDTAYAEYFEWKRYGKLDHRWASSAEPWCQLCQRLHQNLTTDIVEDLDKWYVKDSNCKTTERQIPRVASAKG